MWAWRTSSCVRDRVGTRLGHKSARPEQFTESTLALRDSAEAIDMIEDFALPRSTRAQDSSNWQLAAVVCQFGLEGSPGRPKAGVMTSLGRPIACLPRAPGSWRKRFRATWKCRPRRAR